MAHRPPRVLFVLKFRDALWGDCSYPGTGPSSGLLNSATFVHDMLVAAGIESKLVEVCDNNKIDREVTDYRPTHVIVEALWVVPEKFDVLIRLHPNVIWIIRNHSEIPFLANEGIAMEWLLDYVAKPFVRISNNAPRAQKEFKFLVQQAHPHMSDAAVNEKVIYLPNYYPLAERHNRHRFGGDPLCGTEPGEFNVGCFGAVRPLKNQLLQAVAALKFCDKHGYRLRFHINGTRVEGRGDAILKNIRQMFAKLNGKAELIEHAWMSHDHFLEVVGHMDMGLQVSFSETFNIVAADFVSRFVPVVGTHEIPWMPNGFCADPTDSDDIVSKMDSAWFYWRTIQQLGFDVWLHRLTEYVAESKRLWLGYLSA